MGGRGPDASRPVRLWPATVVVVGISLAIWAVSRTMHREPTPAVAGTSEDTVGDAAPDTTTIELPPAEDGQDEGPRP